MNHDFQANVQTGPSSMTDLAPLQSCARFCLEPETFPIFIAWLKKIHTSQPESFWDPDLVREDIVKGHDAIAMFEHLAEQGFVIGGLKSG